MEKFKWVFVLWIIFIVYSHAQEPSPTPNLNDKAARFHKALLKRPESEALFDRFFDAWLETNTVAELELFLSSPERDTASDWFLAGRYYIRQDQDENAVEAFNKLINSEQAPKSVIVNALVTLSEITSRKQDFDSALKHNKQAQTLLNQEAKPAPDLQKKLSKREGELLVRTSRRHEGLQVWRKLIQTYPEDRFLSEDVISLLVEQGLFDEAIQEQQKLIEQISAENDTYATVLAKIQLGHIYRKANRNEEAISLWQSILSVTGHDSWVEKELLGLIESQYRKNDNLSGLKTKLKEIIEQQPKRLNLLIAEAQLAADLGETQSAIDHWKHILELTPGNKELRLRFVKTLNELNLPDQAASQIQTLIASNPDDNELRFTLAEYQFKAKLEKESIASLNDYLKNSDGSEFTYIRIGRKMAEFEQYQSAQTIFEQLIKKHPTSNNAKDAFAMFLYDDKQEPSKAIQLWTQIGKTGDINGVLLSARQLSQRFESDEAYQILESRLEEFRDNYRFLGEYCLAGITNDKAKEVLPLAIHQAQIATLPSELANAIKLTIDVSKRIPDNFSTAIELTKNSKTKNIRCLYASLLDAAKQNRQANQYLDNYLAELSKPQSLLPLLTLKDLQKKQQSYQDAANTLETVIKEIPGGRKSTHIEELINLYTRLNQTSKALDWINEWKLISPESARPWLMQSRLLEESGRYLPAIRILQNASRRFDEPEILINLAKLEIKNGSATRAEKIYWDLYESSDKPWKKQQWITELAELAVKQRRIDHIIREMQRRKRNNSKSIQPILALADVYRIAKKTDEYRETLISAYALAPDNIELIHRIADLDLKEGKLESARAQLESVLERDKTNRTSKRLINLSLANFDVEKALKLIKRLPAGKRISEDETNELANLFISIGEIETAAKLLSLYKNYYPDNFDLHKNLAFAKLYSQTPEQAVDSFLELIRFDVKQIAPALQSNLRLSPWQSSSYLYNNRYNTVNIRPEDRESIEYWIKRYIGVKTLIDYGALDKPIFALSIDTSPLQSTKKLLIDNQSVRAFVLSTLLTNSDPTEELEKKIIGSGIPLYEYHIAKYLETLDEVKRQQNVHDIKLVQRLYQQHPNQIKLADWYLNIVALDPEHEDIDKGIIDKAYEIVKQQKGIEAAAFVALKCNHVQKALSGFLEADNPSAEFVDTILSYTLSQKNRPLSEEDQTAISNKVQLWLNKADRPQFISNTQLSTLFEYLSEEPQQLMDLIISEWNRKVKCHSQIPTIYQYNRGLGQKFDGFILKDRSPHLVIALNSEKLPETIDYTKIKKWPTLCYLIALHKHDGQFQELKKDIDISSATFNQLLLLAAWAHKESETSENRNETAKIYEKIRLTASEDDHQTKTNADQWIYYLAAGENNSDQLKELGISALLRLRLDPNLPDRYWRGYTNQLVKWGQEKYKDRPVGITRQTNPIARWNTRTIKATALKAFSPPTLSDLYPNYQKLVKAKKVDKAVQLLVRNQLPLHAGELISLNPKNTSYFTNLQRSLSELKQTDAVLNAYKPSDDATLLEIARYGALCEALNKPQEAIEYYQKVLNQHPEHSGIKIRQLDCLGDIDIKRATQELIKLVDERGPEPGNIAVLSASIRSFLNKIHKKAERYDLYNELIPFFEKLDQRFYSNHKMNNNGPQLILRLLEQSSNVDGKTIPRIGQTSENSSEKVVQLTKKRDTLYIDLCKIFIRNNPKISYLYFSNLTRIFESNSIPDAELTELCEFIIQNTDFTFTRSSTFPLQQSDPMIWLIDSGAGSMERQSIEGSLKRIKEKRPVHLEAYQLIDNLYYGPIDNFENTARKFFHVQLSTHSPKWALICHVAKKRDLTKTQFDKIDFSLKTLAERKNKNTWIDHTVYTKTALETFDSEGQQETINYLSKLDSALTTKNDQQQFKRIIDTLLQNPNTWNATMTFLKTKSVEQLKSRNLVTNASRMNYTQYRNKIDELPQLFETLKLLTDVDKLDVLPKRSFGVSERNVNYHTFVGELFRNLRSMWDTSSTSEKAKRSEYNKALEPLTSNTFGTQIVKALGSDSMTEAILKVFQNNLDRIRELPPTKQTELALLAKDLIYINDLPRLLNTDDKKILQWIGEANINNKYNRFAKAKTLEDFDSTITNGVISSSSYLFSPKDILFDWKGYFLAIENYIYLGEKAVKEGILKPQTRTFARSNLSRAVDYNAPVESLGIALSLYNSEKIAPIFGWQDIHRKIERQIEAASADQTIKLFEEYLNEIQEAIELDNYDTRILSYHFYRLFYYLKTDYRNIIIHWSRTEALEQYHKKLVDSIRIGLTIYSARRGELPKDQYAQLEKLLAKERKNDIGTRLIFANCFSYNLKTPYNITEQSARTLIEALELNEPVEENIFQIILTHYATESIALKKEPNKMFGRIIEEYKKRHIGNDLDPPMNVRAKLKAAKPASSLSTKIIMLAILNNDSDSANQILNKIQPTSPETNSTLFHYFIEHQSYDLAARMIKTQWEDLLSQPTAYSYSQKTYAVTSEFLDTLKGEAPWVSSVAKTLIETRKDSSTTNPPSATYADRTSELAKNFDPTIYPNTYMIESVIERISNERTEKILLEQHAKLDGDLSLHDISKQKSRTDQKKKIRNRCAKVALQINAGEYSGYRQLLSQLTEHDLHRNSTISFPVYRILTNSWSTEQPKQVAKQKLPLYLETLEATKGNSNVLSMLISSLYRVGIEDLYSKEILSTDLSVEQLNIIHSSLIKNYWERLISITHPNDLNRLLKDMGVAGIDNPTSLSQEELIEAIAEQFDGTLPENSPLNIPESPTTGE